MRPSLDFRTLLGGAALTVTLLSTGPGVQVTRAEDGPVSAVPIQGPTCEAANPADQTRQIAEYVASVQQEAAAQAAAGGDEIVVLNNRGYNYRPADDDLAAALSRQLDQIRRDTIGK